jgi:ureidoacrylate peracid hydrolase
VTEDLTSRDRVALLVIDMQNDFCHPNGGVAARGDDLSLIQAMAHRLRQFLGVARVAKLPIVHVRTHHSPWTDSPSWTARHDGRHTDICRPGSWGAEFYEGFEPVSSQDWQPGRHEYVVTKHRYSAFIDTELDLVLRSQGIRTLIMTGEASDVCVESTARDAYMKDYFVAFISDCMATDSDGAHQAALRILAKNFGTVLTSSEVVAAWRMSGALDGLAAT